MARVVLKEVNRVGDDRVHAMLAVDEKEWLMKTTWPRGSGRSTLWRGTTDRATARAWLRCLDWAVENGEAKLVSESLAAANALRNS